MKIKIETERLLLRHIIEEDTQDTFEYCRNSDVGPHAGWKPHADLAETRKIMKEVFFEQGKCLGHCFERKQQNGRFHRLDTRPQKAV